MAHVSSRCNSSVASSKQQDDLETRQLDAGHTSLARRAVHEQDRKDVGRQSKQQDQGLTSVVACENT